MDSNIRNENNPVSVIYVRLLNEGVEVSRPVLAREVENKIYEIIQQGVASDETWEFAPTELVITKKVNAPDGEHLLAIGRVDGSNFSNQNKPSG